MLQTDYYGLFRSRKYSGVDRIESANQVSYGASTRFFDSNYKERLNIAFGQIFYLDSKFNPSNKNPDSTSDKTSYSAWAVEMDFNFADYLFYHGGIQYDIDSQAVQLGNSTLEYRVASGYIQANYRYVAKDYIRNTVGDSITNIDDITRDGISQAGILAGYQLSRKWSASGQYYYDLTTDEALEWLANLTYTSDCWYVGFTYSNQLKAGTATLLRILTRLRFMRITSALTSGLLVLAPALAQAQAWQVSIAQVTHSVMVAHSSWITNSPSLRKLRLKTF